MTKHMKTISILLTVLGTTLASMAGSQVILSSSLQYVARGTARVAATNTIAATNALTAVNTNLAHLLTNVVADIPATTASLSVGTYATGGAGTNVYKVEKSLDRHTWFSLTNVSVPFATSNLTRQVVELPSLGNYNYVRVADITNASIPGTATSNYIALHWK